jgi:putative FmdB family regulatory protein
MEVAMPLYDYRCRDCGKRVSVYQSYADYGREEVECPNCGSDQLSRLIGRVRIAKSEEARLDDLSDPGAWGDIDENDPKAMAKMMRKMGREMGEEVPPEFDEVVDRLEAGQSPEEIEGSLPDLGGGADDFDL